MAEHAFDSSRFEHHLTAPAYDALMAEMDRLRARALLAEDRIAAAWNEIEHAYFNGHRLDPGCQGAFGDERDAAVRVSSLRAALTREAPKEGP